MNEAYLNKGLSVELCDAVHVTIFKKKNSTYIPIHKK